MIPGLVNIGIQIFYLILWYYMKTAGFEGEILTGSFCLNQMVHQEKLMTFQN
jgi:hypothetical protein